MWCPQCGTDTRVLETDKLDRAVVRVRWCRNESCRFLFETHEAITGAVVRETPETAGAYLPPAKAAARHLDLLKSQGRARDAVVVKRGETAARAGR
ncbi:hypothetical protein NNJEOMEG_01680 [Fundidesulfovibrio magnetotacticus]|uniref:Uncharacterized protein n=1 Tax=Fundidesulfovibrio magnetotacticus TaxID=2730080 RepID=A0A6V8LQ34_9BACT|nr:hypothetical protein [Fundidesulfovibrio magnetotacticus]GFK93844.1 hypothetical protein NNJEOMEG_01680 [Fundidesulfovibrio magnetotacticus]